MKIVFTTNATDTFTTECPYCKNTLETKSNWFNNYFVYFYHLLKCEYHFKTKHGLNKKFITTNLHRAVLLFLSLFVLACIMAILRIILYPFYIVYLYLFEVEDEEEF